MSLKLVYSSDLSYIFIVNYNQLFTYRICSLTIKVNNERNNFILRDRKRHKNQEIHIQTSLLVVITSSLLSQSQSTLAGPPLVVEPAFSPAL